MFYNLTAKIIGGCIFDANIDHLVTFDYPDSENPGMPKRRTGTVVHKGIGKKSGTGFLVVQLDAVGDNLKKTFSIHKMTVWRN